MKLKRLAYEGMLVSWSINLSAVYMYINYKIALIIIIFIIIIQHIYNYYTTLYYNTYIPCKYRAIFYSTCKLI